MTVSFNNRFYIYGITDDGTREFLNTMLNEDKAVQFAKDHRKMFKDRFVLYSYKTMVSDEVFIQEAIK